MLFRCLRSGNTVDIEQIDDIERMYTHEGYEKVVTHEVPFDVISELEIRDEIQNTHAEAADTPEVKKRGRPRKEK